MVDQGEQEKKEKKGFFARFIDKLDGKMKVASEKKKCCGGSDEKKESSCC